MPPPGNENHTHLNDDRSDKKLNQSDAPKCVENLWGCCLEVVPRNLHGKNSFSHASAFA